MLKTLKAIKKLIEEYNDLSDDHKSLLEKATLKLLCYSYAGNADREESRAEREKKDADRDAKRREIAEREFVPFSYWEIHFNLLNQTGLTVQATDFYPGQTNFVSASDGAGDICVSEDATFLYATQIHVDSVKDLPDWCPTVKCEYGTYRTSPAWVKESVNADD